MPAFLPKTLKVFVAPELPLPCLRTSVLKNRLPTQTAVGIDPIRYEIKMAAI